MFFSRKALEEFIKSIIIRIFPGLLKEYLPVNLLTLDKSKSYILVLPTTFPERDVRDLVDGLRGTVDVNIFIVRSDNIRVVEFE